MSILFVLTYIVIFCLNIYTYGVYPKFQNYPPLIDYSVTEVDLHPMTGSTLAIGVGLTGKTDYPMEALMRIQFQQTAPSSEDTITYDAVYCTDLYAEEIEAERNGTSSTQDYTRAFSDWSDNIRLVCPNATDIVISKANNKFLNAKILSCENSSGSVYAGDVACVDVDDEELESLSI